MTDRILTHLTTDELDDWLAGSLAPAREVHLHGCADCRRLADADRELALRLGTLPLLSPAPGFPDRVMARVSVRRRIRSRAMVAGIAAGIGVPMLASVGWSLANPDTLALLLQGAGGELGRLGLEAARSLGATLLAQPWYPWVRGVLESPARLGLALGTGTAAYIGGVLMLRRLLALPTARVAHGQA